MLKNYYLAEDQAQITQVFSEIGLQRDPVSEEETEGVAFDFISYVSGPMLSWGFQDRW